MLKNRVFKSWMLVSLFFFMTGLATLAMAFVRRALKELPSVQALEDYVPPLVTQVVDTYGQPVGEFFTERRTTVPLNQIPVDLRHAICAIEDTDFYDHWG